MKNAGEVIALTKGLFLKQLISTTAVESSVLITSESNPYQKIDQKKSINSFINYLEFKIRF